MAILRLVSLIALCMLLETAVAHLECDFVQVSLGDAKEPSDCKDKCADYTAASNEDERECVAWMHNAKKETCTGWILDEHAEDDDGDDGDEHHDDDHTTYDDCGLNPDADVTITNAKKNGCSFETIDLGSAKTEEDCENLCTTFENKKYGGCVGWGYNEHVSECSGLVSEPANNSKSCGLP